MSARLAIRELFSGESVGSSCMTCTEAEYVLQCCVERHPFYFILAVLFLTILFFWFIWAILSRKSGNSFVTQGLRGTVGGQDYKLKVVPQGIHVEGPNISHLFNYERIQGFQYNNFYFGMVADAPNEPQKGAPKQPPKGSPKEPQKGSPKEPHGYFLWSTTEGDEIKRQVEYHIDKLVANKKKQN